MQRPWVSNASLGNAKASHHRVTSDLDAFEVTQSGALSTADVGGLRAAGVEGAAARRVLLVAKQGVFAGHLHQLAADHDTHQVQWAQCINAVR